MVSKEAILQATKKNHAQLLQRKLKLQIARNQLLNKINNAKTGQELEIKQWRTQLQTIQGQLDAVQTVLKAKK